MLNMSSHEFCANEIFRADFCWEILKFNGSQNIRQLRCVISWWWWFYRRLKISSINFDTFQRKRKCFRVLNYAACSFMMQNKCDERSSSSRKFSPFFVTCWWIRSFGCRWFQCHLNGRFLTRQCQAESFRKDFYWTVVDNWLVPCWLDLEMSINKLR